MTVHRGRVQAKREVSWTRKKKLAKKSSRGVSELEASPEEIKSREVELGERERERERELDFFCFSCFPTAELRTLSL